MAGELLTGMAQVLQTATEVTAAPMAAAADTVMATATVLPAASVVSETTASITNGLESVRSAVLPPELPSAPSTHLGNNLHEAVAKTGDYHGALVALASGRDEVMPEEALMQQDFLALEGMSPQQAARVVGSVDQLSLPKDIVDDPQFLALFAKEFGQEVAQQEALSEQGKLSKEDYAAMRQGMVQNSAERAMNARRKSSVSEKDLEEIKRKAAMDAIRQHMMLWRQSVMQDKRLTLEAKGIALQRVDKLEQRLLVKEAIRWDGMSVMKLVALASVWMQEVASQ